MIFAREVSGPLTSLVKKIDAETAKHKSDRMGSFVVFLSDDEGLQNKLKDLADKESIKTTVLTIDNPAGPPASCVLPPRQGPCHGRRSAAAPGNVRPRRRAGQFHGRRQGSRSDPGRRQPAHPGPGAGPGPAPVRAPGRPRPPDRGRPPPLR